MVNGKELRIGVEQVIPIEVMRTDESFKTLRSLEN